MNQLDQVEQKTFDVSRGFKYTYYTSPAKKGPPTLLLIHGFPDSTEHWREVAQEYLIPNGYGIVAIDCLGYNGTSKPLEKEAYNMKLMAQDIKEILSKECLDKVISVGHDWVKWCHSSKMEANTYIILRVQ
jgi:soluble epoxide hydrolase/lipid-phosphate phosphatase